MNDESFVGFVLNNASRYDIETLEKIIQGLSDNIASRRWGKPPGLKVGSNVEAILFDTPSFVQYGSVVRLSPKEKYRELVANEIAALRLSGASVSRIS